MKALKCRECGHEYPLEATHVCEFDFGPLEVVYDYERMAGRITRELIESRPRTMWRYRELLPIAGEPTVGTQVGYTPLVRADWAGCESSCNACGQVCPTGAIQPLPLFWPVTRAKPLAVPSVAVVPLQPPTGLTIFRSPTVVPLTLRYGSARISFQSLMAAGEPRPIPPTVRTAACQSVVSSGGGGGLTAWHWA